MAKTKPQETMVGRDIHFKQTDAKGNSFVGCTRVWDAELFAMTRTNDAFAERSKKKGNKNDFQVISKEEYDNVRKP